MQRSVALPSVVFRKGPESFDKSGRLRINVLFTNRRETQLALERAAELSAGLDAEILLIVPQIVPFPLDLDNPPVPLDFASDQICTLAESIDADLEGHIYLCRDRLQTFLHVLRTNSIAVVGTTGRWFFGRTERLARALRRKGHQVILAKSA